GYENDYLSVSASTPGNFLPSKNSSEAPPPVEIRVILSATPALCTAATESLPPTIEVAALFPATTSAILNVPLADAANSNTPIGPFQTMVRAVVISAEKDSTLFGPISKAILSSGIDCPTPIACGCAAASNLSATTWSTGSKNFTLCSFACCK